MERLKRICEEVRVYAGVAERTGGTVELHGLKARPNACSSVRDLVRKYKLFGDGLFYIPAGQWPMNAETLTLDRKWLSMDQALNG